MLGWQFEFFKRDIAKLLQHLSRDYAVPIFIQPFEQFQGCMPLGCLIAGFGVNQHVSVNKTANTAGNHNFSDC